MGDETPMPHRLGAHEILLPIATGGLTRVYLARRPVDASGARDHADYVAVELTGPPSSEGRGFGSALLTSVRPLCRLRCANVVRIFEAASDEHGVYVVTDYVPGDSLAGLRRLAQESGTEIPKPVALRILVDALEGLHAAHELTGDAGQPLRVVHGDFSPRNILVGTDGIARVTGFGLAKAIAASGGSIATDHVAPEGPSDDRRFDIWAAGVIAWETLTGRSVAAYGVAPGTAPPRVSTVAPDVSTALDEVVAQALRVERDARPATALELAHALRAAARAAGLLAELDEVAAHVARAAGPALAERKALLADIRRAQRDRPPSAPDVRTLIGIAGPVPTKRAPLPSLPDAPPPVDDGTSDLRIAIDLPRAPAERANDDILGNVSAISEDEPQVFRSPLAPDAPEQDSPPAAEDREALPVARPSLRRLAGAVKPWVTPPWTTKKISVFAGAGGGLIGFLLVLVAVSGRTHGGAVTAGSAAQGADALAPASVASLEPSSPPEVAAKNAGSDTTTATVHSDDPTQLHIKANGPIASVRVDGRHVDAIVPAPTISVDLEAGERDHPLRVVVTSTDGRVATAITDPAAATTDVEVTFGSKPAATRPRPRPAPATTVKHPWSKSKR